MWRRAVEKVRQRHGDIGPQQFQPTVVRALIDWQVTDLLERTRQRLRHERIGRVDDVRRFPGVLVGLSAEVCELKGELERFLHERVYQHYRVQRMGEKGSRIVTELFAAFCQTPKLLPERYSRRIDDGRSERTVCDYIAGMTDRYAQDEYLRLFQPYTVV
jgi:dGTPase